MLKPLTHKQRIELATFRGRLTSDEKLLFDTYSKDKYTKYVLSEEEEDNEVARRFLKMLKLAQRS